MFFYSKINVFIIYVYSDVVLVGLRTLSLYQRTHKPRSTRGRVLGNLLRRNHVNSIRQVSLPVHVKVLGNGGTGWRRVGRAWGSHHRGP